MRAFQASRVSGITDSTNWDHYLQGVHLDASSAGALHESLQALKHNDDTDLIEIMQLLVTKPMQVRLCAA